MNLYHLECWFNTGFKETYEVEWFDVVEGWLQFKTRAGTEVGLSPFHVTTYRVTKGGTN